MLFEEKMPQLITPKTKIVTKDGECHILISMELTINLNANGLTAATAPNETEVKAQKHPEEKVDLLVPNFESISNFKFGKQE